MKNKKKLIIILFAFFALALVCQATLVFAQDKSNLEQVYPSLGTGVKPPEDINTFLPTYVRYIYHFSIIAGGLIAFLSLIYGGFRFMTSAGNPAATQDAREQIFASLIGLVIILGSYVLLNEINPDLTKLTVPVPYGLGEGIIIYHSTSSNMCGGLAVGSGNEAAFPALVGVDESVKYKAMKDSGSTILGEDDNGDPILPDSFYTFENSDLLRIEYYQDSACEKDPLGAADQFSAGDCVDITYDNVKCIKMIWLTPGVWVFNKLDPSKPNEVPDPLDLPVGFTRGIDYEVFQTSQEALDNSHFHDKIKGIALVPNKRLEINYGAILHNIPGQMMENKGWARIYLPGGSGTTGEPNHCIYDDTNNVQLGITRCGSFDVGGYGSGNMQDASSITIFNVDPEDQAPTAGITICREDRCGAFRIGDDVHEAKSRLEPGQSLTNITPGTTLENVTSKFGKKAEYAFSNNYMVYAANFKDDQKWKDTDEEIDYGYGATGMSSIYIDQKATYIVLLYSEPFNNIKDINTVDGYVETAIINHSVPSLSTIDWNDQTGCIVVINTIGSAL